MKASKLLRSGCIGYLASVVNVLVEHKIKPEDVSVINKFLKVHLEDLLGLSLDREINSFY